MVAELARGDGVEEERLALPRRLVDVRLDAVARRAGALQEIVALGEAQVDELSFVALGRGAQGFERGARLHVPLRAEEAFGASELELVSIRPCGDRPDRQVRQLVARRRREIAERKFVDQT